MGDLTKEDVLENFTYFNKCLKLLEITRETTKKEICSLTKDTENNINLLKLLKFLEENDFIKVNKEYSAYRYVIKRKDIAEFLRQSSLFRNFGRIIELTTMLYHY